MQAALVGRIMVAEGRRVMNQLARGFVAILVAGLLTLPIAAVAESPDQAAGLADADRAAIQALIGDQIAAFRRDDGAAAYSMASPGIQRIFPTINAFMAMVRGGYMPVYRPRSVVFGPLEAVGGRTIQKVFVTGPDGLAYTANYSLERQPDGSWLISGCTLLKPSPTI